MWQNAGSYKNYLVICLLLMAVVGSLYWNSLQNMFTNWDDLMIYANWQIRSLEPENIKKIFTYVRGSTYQPIRVLSYAVDYHFWRLNPLGYHITNIVFYTLACVMVFLSFQRLSMGLRKEASTSSHWRVALFGSLLFAAHPVHVEAVTWLAARKEVLQGFFFFLAFYLYLKGREEAGRKKVIYFISVLFTILLATLSKPSAVVFPAVLLIYEIAVKQKGWIEFFNKHWLFFAFSVLISALFTYILIKVMLDAGGVKLYRGGSFFNNLLVSVYSFLYHIKLLIFTVNYSAAYTIDVPNPVLGFRTILFAGITLFATLLSLWLLKRTKIIFFSFFFFVVTILPYLNIIPISTLLADRYVFIASFSYAFGLGVLFDQLYAYRRKKFTEGFFKLLSIGLFMFLFTVYSLMTIHQNRVWENSYTLWSNAVEKYPGSNTANALMGVVYMDIGRDEEALKYLEKAVQILPYDYQSRNNLGIVYGRLNQPEKGLKELLTAIWLKPDNDNMKLNLSLLYQRMGEYGKAEEVLKSLLEKNPGNAQLHFRLGRIFRDAKRFDDAKREFLKSSELASHIINPYEELGNLYASRLNDRRKAIHYYSKGIEAVSKGSFRVEDLRWMVQDLEEHR